MFATLPVSLDRATPPSSEWTRCWTRKAWFRKDGIMKVTLATCLSLTPTFVRCREPTSRNRNWDGRWKCLAAARWPTFQGPPFQGSLDEAVCWSSSRADVQRCVRQRVDRAGMNLTPPTSPKPAESSESIALILFQSCRIVGCCFQEEDTHIQKDGGKKRHWGLLKATSKSPALYSESGRLRLRSYTCFFEDFPPCVSENAIPWWNMPLIFRWTSWAMQRWQRCASIRPRVLVSDPIGAKRLDTQSSDAWQAVAIHCYSDDEVPVEIG